MRRHPRYEAFIDCELAGDRGMRASGTLVDISIGGAGIKLNGWDGSELLALGLTHSEQRLILRCEVRHAQPLWGKILLHTQFTGLTDEEAEGVQRIVEDLRVEEERAAKLVPRGGPINFRRLRERMRGKPDATRSVA